MNDQDILKLKKRKRISYFLLVKRKFFFFFHVNINFKTPGVFMGVFLISKHGDKSPSSVGAN